MKAKNEQIKDLQVKIMELEEILDSFEKTISDKNKAIDRIKFELDSLINCINDAIEEAKDI